MWFSLHHEIQYIHKATARPGFLGTVPEIRTMSETNFMPFFNFFFLMILFTMETFLHLVSDFPSEKMATVLHMEQVIVKMYVRYKNHDRNMCIILTAVSILSPSVNRPRKM